VSTLKGQVQNFTLEALF